MPLAMLVASCTFTSCQPDEPRVSDLKKALQSMDLISAIEANPDTAAARMKAEGLFDYKEQYSMFFTQDLNHEDEGGESFQQRVCILFRGFDRPTMLVTEGYDWSDFRDGADLALNLGANMIHVEHRNYGQSYNSDLGQWQYQTVAQASADLHAVYETFKPLFKGKWLCSGTSKSGEGSITYAYFYPNDMDLAVGFCAPFVLGLDDPRFGDYLFNVCGSAYERELMKTGLGNFLQDGEDGFYREVCDIAREELDQEPNFSEYVFNLFDTYFQVFQSYSVNEDRTQMLEEMATDDEVLLSELCYVFSENRDDAYRAYFVELAKEMGWQDNGYSYMADMLTGTSFDKDDVLTQTLKEEDRWVIGSYDGTVYQDIVNDFFMNSTCPLLLFYVKDDPWSGGIPERVGPNAKVIINPIGIHSPFINDPVYCPESVKQEVMDYVHKFI